MDGFPALQNSKKVRAVAEVLEGMNRRMDARLTHSQGTRTFLSRLTGHHD